VVNPRPTRVLLIDDEPELLQFHVRALTAAGYEVEVVPAITQAWDYCLMNYGDSPAGRQAPDVLILDMMMPVPDHVMPVAVDDGLATGAYILAQHRRRNGHVPAIVLSNLNERETTEALCRVCRDVLPNPPRDNTVAVIRTFLLECLNVTVHEKRRTPPFLLPSLVARRLGHSSAAIP
jgi:CheY-like chemotaxis protein